MAAAMYLRRTDALGTGIRAAFGMVSVGEVEMDVSLLTKARRSALRSAQF